MAQVLVLAASIMALVVVIAQIYEKEVKLRAQAVVFREALRAGELRMQSVIDRRTNPARH